MRRVTLLALSLMFFGVGSHECARAQTSATPPVSLAPPDASPPRTNAKNSRVPPAASGTEAPPPVIYAPGAPHPGTDYDGFSASTAGDNDAPSQVTPSQVMPPARSRAAKDTRSNPDTNGAAEQSPIDQEDEALKRRLTICKNCK